MNHRLIWQSKSRFPMSLVILPLSSVFSFISVDFGGNINPEAMPQTFFPLTLVKWSVVPTAFADAVPLSLFIPFAFVFFTVFYLTQGLIVFFWGVERKVDTSELHYDSLDFSVYSSRDENEFVWVQTYFKFAVKVWWKLIPVEGS